MKTLPSKMTHAWLVKHDACLEHRKMFSAEWPDGADATEANLNRAAEIGLDLEWLAQLLLTPAAYDEYQRQIAPLKAECQRQIAPLDDEYERQIAPTYAECRRRRDALDDEYRRRRDALDDEYERQLALADDEYQRQIAPLDDEYERQIAPTYAEYRRQIAPVQAEYRRQCDALIIRTLIAELPINLKGKLQ